MKAINVTRTKKLTLVAIFIALITVGALFKVPIGPVPISLQLLFVILAGLLLGGNLGALTVLLYVVMGLCGLPVFTGGGGIGYVLQPTFGYTIGFIIGAFACGHIAYAGGRTSFLKMLIGALVALVIVDLIGVLYLYLMSNYYLGNEMSFEKAMEVGVLVFLLKDTCLCVLSAIICPRLVPILKISNCRVYSSFTAITVLIRLKSFGIKLLRNDYVYERDVEDEVNEISFQKVKQF